MYVLLEMDKYMQELVFNLFHAIDVVHTSTNICCNFVILNISIKFSINLNKAHESCKYVCKYICICAHLMR